MGGILFVGYLAIVPGCGSISALIIDNSGSDADFMLRYDGEEVWRGHPFVSGVKIRIPVRWGGGALTAQVDLVNWFQDSRQPDRYPRLVTEPLAIPSNVFPYVIMYVIEVDRVEAFVYNGFVHSNAEPGTWWWSILNGAKHGVAVMSCPLKGIIPYATLETRDAICRAIPFLCPTKQDLTT